jgi:excisionase family DNA binding protein
MKTMETGLPLTNTLPELLPADETARALRVSPRELKRLREKGRIAFYRTGHRTCLFAVEDIQKFLRASRVEVAT